MFSLKKDYGSCAAARRQRTIGTHGRADTEHHRRNRAHEPSDRATAAAGSAAARGRRTGKNREATQGRQADRARARGRTARFRRLLPGDRTTDLLEVGAGIEQPGHALDSGAYFQEIGLLIAYDRYDGQAPA